MHDICGGYMHVILGVWASKVTYGGGHMHCHMRRRIHACHMRRLEIKALHQELHAVGRHRGVEDVRLVVDVNHLHVI
jgi:hypothetical protein